MLTGLRRSEVVGLSWYEVNLDEGWMMIREAITAAEPEEELDEWDNAELERLGTKSEAGERYVGLSQDNIAVLKAWKRLQAMERLKAGETWHHDIPLVTFHGLRHGSATAQLAAGTTPRVISEALGHSRTAFTMDTYVQVVPDVQKEAAEAAAAIVPRRSRGQGAAG